MARVKCIPRRCVSSTSIRRSKSAGASKPRVTRAKRVFTSKFDGYQALVGLRVSKKFGKKRYQGLVARMHIVGAEDSVLNGTGKTITGPLYGVVYDDGDQEELEPHELISLLPPSAVPVGLQEAMRKPMLRSRRSAV